MIVLFGNMFFLLNNEAVIDLKEKVMAINNKFELNHYERNEYGKNEMFIKKIKEIAI